jgi:hypothetical protein
MALRGKSLAEGIQHLHTDPAVTVEEPDHRATSSSRVIVILRITALHFFGVAHF